MPHSGGAVRGRDADAPPWAPHPGAGRRLARVCTVIIDVPDEADGAVRLVAVRDEDPGRPWRALGEWWPRLPGVIGVQDIRAGSAWLAADPGRGRLAILLNRADTLDVPEDRLVSRGTLPLASVSGEDLDAAPPTHGFNLLEVDGTVARVRAWDGRTLVTAELPPGVHMLAHDGVDDPRTSRIARWLPDYRAARPAPGADPASSALAEGATSANPSAPTDLAASVIDLPSASAGRRSLGKRIYLCISLSKRKKIMKSRRTERPPSFQPVHFMFRRC